MEYFLLLDKHLPEGVGIGMYGPEHTGWLIAAVIICILLCLVYVRLTGSDRRRLEMSVAGFILFLEAFRIAAQIIAGVFNASYWPLHLCGLSVYFTMIYTLSKNELIGNVLYGISMPSAIAALAFPNWLHYPLLNMQSIQSFLVHILLMAYPIMLMAGGELRPRAALLPKCMLFIMSFAVPIYFLNKQLDTNFFFLNWPSPGSPLVMFEKLLGNPGYLFGFIPMLAVVWLVLYLPIEIVRHVQKRGRGVPVLRR